MPVHSRWTDNPFRDPNLTPEQVERIEARHKALRIYRETGNSSLLEEIGFWPSKADKKDEAGNPTD